MKESEEVMTCCLQVNGGGSSGGLALSWRGGEWGGPCVMDQGSSPVNSN